MHLAALTGGSGAGTAGALDGGAGPPVCAGRQGDPVGGEAGLAVGRGGHRGGVPLLVQLVVPGSGGLEGGALHGRGQQNRLEKKLKRE